MSCTTFLSVLLIPFDHSWHLSPPNSQHACVSFFTSFPDSPLLIWTFEPKNLKYLHWFCTQMFSLFLGLIFNPFFTIPLPFWPFFYLHPTFIADHSVICKHESCVNLSITKANIKGLGSDSWCTLTFTLNTTVVPTAHLTAVSQLSYTALTFVSATPILLQWISLCTSLSAFLKQKMHP